MKNYALMTILINRELEKAYDELAKWYKTFKELTEEDPEYYAAKEQLDEAEKVCIFWMKEQQNLYAMSA